MDNIYVVEAVPNDDYFDDPDIGSYVVTATTKPDVVLQKIIALEDDIFRECVVYKYSLDGEYLKGYCSEDFIQEFS